MLLLLLLVIGNDDDAKKFQGMEKIKFFEKNVSPIISNQHISRD
jgi:hypothetical protein